MTEPLYTEQAKKQGRVFLIGMTGSGKTTLGKKLASKLKLGFCDLDSLIEAREQKTIREIFKQQGQEYFRKLEREVLHESAEHHNTFIATGGGTPCYYDNIDFINTIGISIYLEASVKLLTERLSKGLGKRPLLANETMDTLPVSIEQILRQREVFYRQAHIKISVPVKDTESLAQAVFTMLLDD